MTSSEHGRPAGLRTSILVCLAACVAMIQVNLLLPLAGRPSNSFVMNDLMRLPLGILSGMGFIGGGAILRRDNFVFGVTTAATLWFLTVIGLCFGGGQIGIGLVFALSPGHEHDAPHGRALLEELGPMPEGLPMLMDRPYEGNETRQLVLDLGMIPVVPPKSNRLQPWDYDHAIYKKRNEIERLFRRLKGFRRIFSRFEKLDVIFLGFLSFALVVEALRAV